MDAGAAAQKGGKKGGKKGKGQQQQAGGKKPQQQAQQGKGQQQKGQAPQQKKGKGQQQKAAPAKPEEKPQQQKAAPVKEEKPQQQAQQGKGQQKKGKGQQQKAAPAKPEVAAEPPQKKAKAEPEAEEKVETELSEAVQKELADLQEELANIAKEELKAVAKVTREFNGKRKPTLEKRKTVTSKIPGFWLQALANTPAAGLITDADAEIFKYLKDIAVIEPTNDEADKSKSDDDFKIVFTFDKNPFFQNKQLWKEVKYAGDSEEVPPTVTGSTINWNKGKNPAEKKAAEPAAGQKQKGKRPIEDVDEDSSFFEWFSSTEIETVDLGEWFRDKFYPNAVKYFFGDVSDDEDDFDDMDSEEEEEFARQFGGDDDDDDDEDGDE